MEKEIWKDIEGYEKSYKVSNKGNIYSKLTNKILKLNVDTKGYPLAFLYKDGKRATCKVHRLVANAFVDNPENKEQVNHIDGNKRNNTSGNLEWCTNLENMRHAYANGLNRGHGGLESCHCKEITQFDKKMNKIKDWLSMDQAAKALGIKAGNISHCCRKKIKSIGGFIFRYKEA